ncbi:MAG TPA: DNA polymerase III subunit delta' [Methylophilaceae bacterium]|jgi:DNA polymerase-3 subunit delta'
MINNEIYPWHAQVWQRLNAMRSRMPHALLLKGRGGIGKYQFAQALAQSLICSSPNAQGLACGVCSSCHWFVQDNHPDYRLIEPEQDESGEETTTKTKGKKRVQILFPQILALGSFFELGSHLNGGSRVVVIHPAEALNTISANALLKILEEPPQGVVFILVSHQPQRLLATILSRCHQIDMPVPDTEQAEAWLAKQGIDNVAERLAYAGGSPLLAQSTALENSHTFSVIWQQLTQGSKLDVFVLAPLLVVHGMDVAATLMQKWVYDILACKLVGVVRYHPQHLNALQGLAERVDLAMLLGFQRSLVDEQKSATHPLNHELQIEHLLLNYVRMFGTHISKSL